MLPADSVQVADQLGWARGQPELLSVRVSAIKDRPCSARRMFALIAILSEEFLGCVRRPTKARGRDFGLLQLRYIGSH